MRIFVAMSFSSKVDPATGEVLAAPRAWLENILAQLKGAGYQVFCALRDDHYRINNIDPAAAFRMDVETMQQSDVVLAFVDGQISAGVQFEIGYGLALGKKVVLAHDPNDKLAYINNSGVLAGALVDVALPLDMDRLRQILES